MNDGDRALDFWLAERVMGYQRIESEMFVSWVLAADHSTRAPFGEHAGYPVDDDVPHYTGRDCLQLVEALQAKEWRVVITFLEPYKTAARKDGATCHAQIVNHKEYWLVGDYANTPGLALGRAAEQALGGAK